MICCFIGHRRIENEESVRERVENIIRSLLDCGTREFIFGDHSEFCDICYEVLSQMITEYSDIVRIHYSTLSKNQSESVMRFFVFGYEKTVFAEDYYATRATKAIYVIRDRAMIDESDVCVFYYSSEYIPIKKESSKTVKSVKESASGTRIAFEYAVKKNKKIINLF